MDEVDRACSAHDRNAYRILVGNLEGNRPLGRPIRENIINMNVKESGSIWTGFIMSRARFQCPARVNALMKPRVKMRLLFRSAHVNLHPSFSYRPSRGSVSSFLSHICLPAIPSLGMVCNTEDGGNLFLQNVGKLPHYMTKHSSRRSSFVVYEESKLLRLSVMTPSNLVGRTSTSEKQRASIFIVEAQPIEFMFGI
jgi:hypothetical protein